LLAEVAAYQSTIDKLLTQKLQILGGAAADENDSNVKSKLIRFCFVANVC